jgi:hypothetical protein
MQLTLQERGRLLPFDSHVPAQQQHPHQHWATRGMPWQAVEDIFVGLRLKDLQIAKNVLPSVLSEQRHKKALVSVTARGRQFGTKHSVAEPTLVSTTLSEFVCLRA